MKRTKMWIFAAIALMGVAFASCDKENEETETNNNSGTSTTTTAAAAVAGDYAGYTTTSVAGSNMGATATHINITKTGDNSVSIALPTMGEGRMAISAFSIDNVSVAKSGNGYTLTKEEYSVDVPRSSGEGTITYTGSLSGTVANGQLTLTYSLQPGAMPMSINFTFSQDIADVVVGSYTDTLYVTVGSSADTMPATIAIIKESASTVSVSIPAYGEGRSALSAFTVEGVSVAASGAGFSLTKAEYSVTPASTEYTGSLNGIVLDGELSLLYTVKPGAMPMNINCQFGKTNPLQN